MTAMNNNAMRRYDEFVSWGNSGREADVDLLMTALVEQKDLATSRLVDFALSLVSTREGVDRLNDYLFHGSEIQRNYAALYFKRRGHIDRLTEAVAQGKIDWVQAFSR